MKRATRPVFILTVLFLAGWAVPQLRGQTYSNQMVYSNGLLNGWADWSWASDNLSCTSPVRPGDSDSISVSCQGYSALYLEHPDFDSKLFTNLTFWLDGGASGGQVVTIAALLGGSETTNTVDVGPLAANTWQQFTVSLASLGASAQPNLDGFWFANDSGDSIPTFYVNDIVLIGGPPPPPPPPPPPNPTNFIGVDAGADRHPISPLIYGTAGAGSNELADLNFTLNRSGGNEETTYNWEINAHGKGQDYFFESYPDDSATPGESADAFVANSKMGGAQALITIPMIGWAPKLGPQRAILPSFSVAKYGTQKHFDPFFADAGNGILASDGALITWNDPNDANIPVDVDFQKGYVQHLTNAWGVSTNGGVGYYIMDNEHSIWQSTHQDIHPVGATMREILGKIVTYASMVKSLDPHALVLGPEEWGWPGYFYSGYDQQWSGQNTNYDSAEFPDRTADGGWDYMPWLLHQLEQYNATNGQRLLDYFTLHCYPQENGVYDGAVDHATELLRNQSTRQFWDPNYVDPSWIDSVIMLIPRMSNWVAAYYPGTRIGITEYNWGAEASMNGATAQADILGIFGREGLDLATRWTIPANNTPTYLAMKIYRNYDGNRSTFGDTSTLAGGPNPDNVAVFAAQRSTDEALTLMVVDKYLKGPTPLVINLTNFMGNGTAQVWQANASNVIARLPDLNYTNGVLETTSPSPSITLLVLPPSSKLSLTPGAARIGGHLAFSVSGETGRTFVLESGSDLRHWNPVSTNTFGGTNAQFLLPLGQTAQFYRAVLMH